MQAIQMHETGDPEVLRYEEADTPKPGDGEVLVRIEAVGVNFIDIYQRTGRYDLDYPFTPGMEGAGMVEAVGPGVEDVSEGEPVAWSMHPGSYAEAAVVPAELVVRIPDDVEFEQAAAVMLQGCTAHYLTQSTFPIQEGQTALIHAAAGGVGHLLVQLAKRRGARVLGTASTDEKVALARECGADEVIRYTETDFVEEVNRLTDGAGVDVVYDSVGKDTFERGFDCLRPRGYMVLFGQSSGDVAPVDPQTLNRGGSLFLTRPNLKHYISEREELLQRTRDVFSWLASGELRAHIDRTWPLAEAAEAHRHLQGRQSKGSLVLIP